MRPPHLRFTVRRMMFAVTVVAAALVRAELAMSLLILAITGLAVRSLIARPAAGRGARPWAIPYLVTLACLYLPFGWVLWQAPFNRGMWGAFFAEFRWAWCKAWPVLPAFFPLFAAHLHRPLLSDQPLYSNAIALIAAGGSLLLIATFTSLGRPGWAAMVVANAIALLGAGAQSWWAYQLYLNGWIPFTPIVEDIPPWAYMAAFLAIPLSGALAVGLILVIASLWRRMTSRVRSRWPAPAPGAPRGGPVSIEDVLGRGQPDPP